MVFIEIFSCGYAFPQTGASNVIDSFKNYKINCLSYQ